MVLAQTFETFRAYYLQSSGQLFEQQCRASGLSFLEFFDELSKTNPRIKDPVALGLGENTNVEDILSKLRKWASGGNKYPYDTHYQSRFMLWALITSLKTLLIIELGLKRFPIMVVKSEEQKY